ncbi:ribbon-helix-helix domain-containing protein [Thermogymnomonas acidicola]|uniref:ribbon-helix-helix domain-containing protein n=1 Tax=Thermogymnomonas acidicola TaxID=399579 RepID=UPI00166C5A9C|nr:ribbon-helix-helix domain-containing protein [Thermogymnomonas acidicola]
MRSGDLESKDTKLVIRISQADIEEIDEFIERNPRFSNRSEFIRHATMDYIARSRAGIIEPQNNGINVKIDRAFQRAIQKLVSEGLFSSVDDFITAVLQESLKTGLVRRMIQDKQEQYRSLLGQLGKDLDTDSELEHGGIDK